MGIDFSGWSQGKQAGLSPKINSRAGALPSLQREAIGAPLTRPLMRGGYSSEPDARSGEFTHRTAKGLAGEFPGTSLLEMIFMPIVNALRGAFGYTRSEFLQKDAGAKGTPIPDTELQNPPKIDVTIGPSVQESQKGEK